MSPIIPISRAMVCLDDEAIFQLDGGQLVCPACGGEAFIPLQAWIGSREPVGED